MKTAHDLYAALLTLYPPRYRKAFGAEMRQTFLDQITDIERSEDCVSLAFWLTTLADEIPNILEQHRIALLEEHSFLRDTPSKRILTAMLFLPLYAVFYAALVRTALVIPHPPISGIGVLVVLATLLLFAGILSAVTGYLLASALVSLFSRGHVRKV